MKSSDKEVETLRHEVNESNNDNHCDWSRTDLIVAQRFHVFKDEFSHFDLNECFLVCSDRSPANSGGQPCKKHELYVSFSDLGWKVSDQFQLLLILN